MARREPKLRWNGSLRAQEEADAAFKQALNSPPKEKSVAEATKRALKKRRRKRRSKKSKRARQYRAYLRTKHWKETAAWMLERSGGCCFQCSSEDDITVHHRHYRTLWREEEWDLEVLCWRCHKNRHLGIETADPLTEEFRSLEI